MNDAIPAELNRLTERITGCASEARRQAGPGWLESALEAALAIEVKRVVRHEPHFVAQLPTCLKISGKRLGLLLNFNPHSLRGRIRPFVN